MNVGDLVKIPEYNKIAEYFGEAEPGLPKVIPGWDRTYGEMYEMCGGEYIVEKILTLGNEAIILRNTKGHSFTFDKKIFTFNLKKEKKLTNKTIDINSIIFKKIRHRYQMVDQNRLPGKYLNYGIVDSLYPYEMYKTTYLKGDKYRKKTGAVAISERIARDLEIPHLNILELIGIYGYTKTAIKEILLKVKKKNFNICIIGWGGTGTNFTHWLSQLAILTNTNKIFQDLIVADNDDFDTVNLLRVPFILREMEYNDTVKKVSYFTDYASLAHSSYLMQDNITAENVFTTHIHYGAPGLETRKMLVDKNIPFIAATHRDNACSLMLNPELDTELMVETYGKIALTPFFLNHIRMTISFMEFLADDNTTMESLRGAEKSILKYDFVKANQEIVAEGIRISGRTMYPIVSNPANTIEIEV